MTLHFDTADTRIARIASRRHGLVTLDQLRRAGVSEGRLRARLGSGALIRAGAGVYRLAGAPRTWEQRALEGCLLAGRGAVLHGGSAATVWHLDLPAPGVIDVAVPHGRWVSAGLAGGTDLRVHRVRTLEAVDCTHVGVLPVTTLARTLVDLGRVLHPVLLRRVIDDSLSRGFVRPSQVEAALRRLGVSGRAGAGHVRSALTPWLAGVRHDSVAEADCRRLLAEYGLPTPQCQFAVTRPDGTMAILDFAWPEARVALEVDGYRWHGSPAAHAGDSVRANQLASLGWTVLRVTPAELRTRPHAVLAALRRRLVGAG